MSDYFFNYKGRRCKVHRGTHDKSVYVHDDGSSPFWYELDRSNPFYFEVRGHYLKLCLQELKDKEREIAREVQSELSDFVEEESGSTPDMVNWDDIGR